MAEEETRSVVVTGASSGIGAACAEYLDERGFRVFATVRRQEDADRITALGRTGLEPLLLDVTDAESIAKAAENVRETLAHPPYASRSFSTCRASFASGQCFTYSR